MVYQWPSDGCEEMSTEGSDYKFEAQTTLDPHLCCSVHAVKFSSEKVQTSLFSQNERGLVTFALVVKVWELWLCSSPWIHFFSWNVPASHKKHSSIRNFKKFISHVAVPLCGWNGKHNWVISFLAKEKTTCSSFLLHVLHKRQQKSSVNSVSSNMVGVALINYILWITVSEPHKEYHLSRN